MDIRAKVPIKKLRLAALITLILPMLAIHGIAAQTLTANISASQSSDTNQAGSQIKHVLLISVDGMHQSDLEWYITDHPDSTLAQLANNGMEYTNTQTSDPSDSDPGGTALMTGADPGVAGVYYDDEYNHDVYPAGTTSCNGQPTGGDVIYDSPDDLNDSRLDAGQNIPGIDQNPALIMDMTSNPQTLLNASTFPVDPTTCQPIWPHSYLQVNTIFDVAHDAGLWTAWSDKHPVYESFNGPCGCGIDDLFTPEIDSNAVEPNGQPYPGGIAWTGDEAATKQYDGYKVQAIINEIDGYDHSGRYSVGVPAIFGMNFQVVSVAEKLIESPAVLNGPAANGSYTLGPEMPGGYLPGTTTPGPLLQSALDYVNAALQRMVAEIQAQGLSSSTAIILTAKHGQSPQDPTQLLRIADGPIVTAINNAWNLQTGCTSNCAPLIVYGTDDDVWQSYLSVKTQAAANFVQDYLWDHSAPAVTYSGATVSVPHSGLAQIFAGQAAANFFGVPYSDPRHPDVFGIVQVGVVYTTGTKIAEHGGDNPADRDVPLVVYAPGTVKPGLNGQYVETTSVAPTILALLGLDPNALQAVQIEHTPVLPGITESSTIGISTVNLAGGQITGYYTTLWQNGAEIKSCFSPCSFTVTSGQTYQVMASSYGSETFSHWMNDGSIGQETVTASSAGTTIKLTAVYSP
jgi:arylsulfatase A-like enzyme